jgi:hypothetical protein
MVRPIQFKREVFADRRFRHRTTFGLQPDDLVTIVDKHVEVLQEVLAVYTSHVADDGCQMTLLTKSNPEPAERHNHLRAVVTRLPED